MNSTCNPLSLKLQNHLCVSLSNDFVPLWPGATLGTLEAQVGKSMPRTLASWLRTLVRGQILKSSTIPGLDFQKEDASSLRKIPRSHAPWQPQAEGMGCTNPKVLAANSGRASTHKHTPFLLQWQLTPTPTGGSVRKESGRPGGVSPDLPEPGTLSEAAASSTLGQPAPSEHRGALPGSTCTSLWPRVCCGLPFHGTLP